MHLQNDTFKKISAIKGFISSKILHRELKHGIEFLVITEWEDINAIKQFAGEEFNIAVVPQVVKDIMIESEKEVKLF